MKKTQRFNLENEEDIAAIHKILFDDESDNQDELDVPDESDLEDEDQVETREENSDTKQSNEECNSEESDCENYLAYRRQRGKDIDSMSWRKLPFSARRKLGKQNLLVHLPGVIGTAKNAKTMSSSWYCFMNDSILDQIVKYTNQYIEFILSEYAKSRDASKTDFIEIKAFIGLFYLAGVYKSARLTLEDLWASKIKAFIGLFYLAGVYKSARLTLEDLWASNGDGIEIFRLTMSLSRFRFIMRCLRFDDRETRPERLTMSLSRFRFIMRCLRFDDRETRPERKQLEQ
ncbi:Transposase IS4 [Popillia japonica]|uniref:Transposase IS4 n=1 Tax=Popillia japonica TaxID=7064 RepID=A0AAW1KBA7_POPJA